MAHLLRLTLTGCMVCILFACGGKKKVTEAPPQYTVISLDTSSAVVYTEYSAVLQSNTVVEIRPKISGYLAKIEKPEGSSVKKGDVIFRVDDADYRQNVNAAKAAMQSAKANEDNKSLEVRKLTPLVESNIISPFELETAKSNLEAAKAQYNQCKAQYENSLITLGYTKITSPVDGVLGRIYVREGSLISSSAQDALTTVSSYGDVLGYFSFDEKKLAPIRKKMMKEKVYSPQNENTVELVLADGSIYEYKGTLESASGIIDRTTGSIQLKVIFPNPDMSILTGSSGVLRFPITYHGCIVIPQSATYELQDKIMIFVVNQDNTISRKTITIEGISDSNYVVYNLERGLRIVTEGVDKLKEGMTITPKEADNGTKAAE